MLFRKIMITAGLLAASLAAHADVQIVGGQIVVAETGHVTATFLDSDAGYTDLLYFDNGGAQLLFNGHATVPGTAIDLGEFAAGTVLNFRMHVDNTGDNFVMGPASSNIDGFFHAAVTLDASHAAVVGFEDLYGGGDQDFNDLQFRVSNVASVPEPETYAMLLGGMGLLGLLARRRKTS